MGLAISVGYLTELLSFGEDNAASFRTNLAELNRFLAVKGLKPHIEPASCSGLSFDMYGYSGLHYLRRIAAHLDRRGCLPPPGDKEAVNDPILAEYFREAEPEGGSLNRLLGRPKKPRSFDHLILHSDAEGFYLPQDFPAVLFPQHRFEIPGGLIGSSHRLAAECQRLAEALDIPPDLDPDSDELWDATQSQGEGNCRWKEYGVESFTCLRLHAAASASLTLNSAVVFH